MQTQSNKIDFKGQNIYVGFDVHLKELDSYHYDGKTYP